MLRSALMGARFVWFAIYLIYAAVVIYFGYEKALETSLINHTSADHVLTWTAVIALTPGPLLLQLAFSRTDRDT